MIRRKPRQSVSAGMRAQTAATLLVLAAAISVPFIRGDSQALRMNDYAGFGDGQSLWTLSEQRLFVAPVPAFNQPVRIRAVELRTVYSQGQFDRPDAYLLEFQDADFYDGVKLTTEAGLDAYTNTAEHTPRREPLDSRRVQALDNQLSIVIPVNIHSPGCHEAQIVLKVSTNDGALHSLATRWYVAVDTGVSEGSDFNLCARPRPTPTGTPS
jgi:hypothetical protein